MAKNKMIRFFDKEKKEGEKKSEYKKETPKSKEEKKETKKKK